MTTIVGISPFARPAPLLVAALVRASATGVLDLGPNRASGMAALALVRQTVGAGFGIVAPDWELDERDYAGVTWVVVPAPLDPSIHVGRGRTVVAQVCSVVEARCALDRGATALIAKGFEAGGRIGAESAFVLQQRILSVVNVPVYCHGGIGPSSVSAALTLGAAGVVLDSQLALFPECALTETERARVLRADGSDTVVIDGRRVLRVSPGNSAIDSSPPGRPDCLSAGQDTAFAVLFRSRYQDVAAVVRGLQRDALASVKRAARIDVLSANNAFAREHDVRLPIVQGPMTRVSDRPEFARAVTEAGGLPLMALSLLTGERVRALLAATKIALGDRPYGVGILGFAPPEIIQPQIDAILENPPPFALIAGWEPETFKRLERAGVRSFVHTPSPALIAMAHKAGARRFVLEGSECGGHVGPRTSFVLWELAIESLLRMERVDDVSVLFAGGVHDDRSAACVAVMASRLAGRGAKIGILMGTAYLFTKEAVESGAILPAYQDVALNCVETVLLETGPGHLTRVARTSFVSTFEQERERLVLQRGARAALPELEQLNLGRLRLAAKGLRHGEGGPQSTTLAEQLSGGLYMMGAVAALREEAITIEALHDGVTRGSARIVQERASHLECPPLSESSPIAIVGMACIFPEAPNLHAFWRNVVTARDSVTECPSERWNHAVYYDPAGRPGKSISKWGAFVPETLFEPDEFGVPPTSLASVDPAQLLALIVAKAALGDAGLIPNNPSAERTSVIFGATSGGDLVSAFRFRATQPGFLDGIPGELTTALPDFTEDVFPGILANVITGRISNRLNLGGLNCTIDAACASSLAAIDLACKELKSGSADVAVAGGVDLHCGIENYLNFTLVKALSPDGRCRPFDNGANGTVLGEGTAAIVLKRLADAERDGDRIYAVIRGLGSSSDGRSLGLTAPNRAGQLVALRRAYADANVDPATVGLVEAHATGTVVGDATELTALTELFREEGAASSTCTLGSVKSNIGHTRCAAGMAGVLKAALSTYHGILPPTVNLKTPHPLYSRESSPFLFRHRAAPWIDEVRTAGVSAMGFGGTNFHVVLESQGTPQVPGLQQWPYELLVLRGDSLERAREHARATVAAYRRGEQKTLTEVAFSAATASDEPIQIAIVVASLEDAFLKLEKIGRAADTPGAVYCTANKSTAGKVAFLFPGQGSQHPEMLGELALAFPEIRGGLRRESWLVPLVFPGAAFSDADRAGQSRAIRATGVAQPALGVFGLALAEVFRGLGVAPDLVGGHSYGELVAASVGGMIAPEHLAEISKARAAAIEAAIALAGGTAGAMAAVSADLAAVRRVLMARSGVYVANLNGPSQTVIAGGADALRGAVHALREQGVSVVELDVACAFHTPLLSAAPELFADTLAGVDLGAPKIPVWSNVTASPHDATASNVRRLLCEQIVSPVRFHEQIRAMYDAGARTFVEVGPGSVLTKLVESILADCSDTIVAAPGTDGLCGFLLALSQLMRIGVPVDVCRLFAGRVAKFGVSDRRPSSICWVVNGQGARPMSGDRPSHGFEPPKEPFRTAHTREETQTGSSDAAVVEYMRTVREVLAGQKEVLLAHLRGRQASPELALEFRPATRAEPFTAAVNDTSLAPPLRVASPATRPSEALLDLLVTRTGYPREMLDLALDLEADLGIDSIKRTEIIGSIAEQHGADPSQISSALRSLRTLREIGQRLDEWMRSRSDAGCASDAGGAREEGSYVAATASSANDAFEADGSSAASQAQPPKRAADERHHRSMAPPIRFELRARTEVLQGGPQVSFEGFSIAIPRSASGLDDVLAAALREKGAYVSQPATVEEASPSTNSLVYLTMTREDGDPAKSLHRWYQHLARTTPRLVAAVSVAGPRFGARQRVSGASGVGGLLKSLARELPEAIVRSVEFDGDETDAHVARCVVDELATVNGASTEVAYVAGQRRVLKMTAAPLERARSNLALGPRTVVVATGGGRGITAHAMVELARRFGGTFELIGRSDLPTEGEDEIQRHNASLPSLRAELAESGRFADLHALERCAQKVISAQRIRSTLQRIRQAGGKARYTSVDVRDSGALSRFIASVYADHGRVDGVIHGAGVIDDGPLAAKSFESFASVYDTKVDASRTLLASLRSDVQFVAFFSSISAVVGNAGQCDYAAANDYLDQLAWAQQDSKTRFVSFNWGPWGGGDGMVTPELADDFTRRDVSVLDPDLCSDAFVDELVYGSGCQVILSGEASGRRCEF